jgi:hypothetical protein
VTCVCHSVTVTVCVRVFVCAPTVAMFFGACNESIKVGPSSSAKQWQSMKDEQSSSTQNVSAAVAWAKVANSYK